MFKDSIQHVNRNNINKSKTFIINVVLVMKDLMEKIAW